MPLRTQNRASRDDVSTNGHEGRLMDGPCGMIDRRAGVSRRGIGSVESLIEKVLVVGSNKSAFKDPDTRFLHHRT